MTPAQLKQYLEKIGFKGEIAPTLENLIQIVEGQIFTVPFETIDLHDESFDVLPNRGITFNFNTHFNRVINENRGGHCAILNFILLKALQSFGFKVTPILPDTLRRIKEGETPSQHCAGIVSLPEGDYLVDAGFGGVGLLSPVLLKEGEYQQYSEKFKVTKDSKYDFKIHFQNDDKWECIYGLQKKPSSYKEFERINQLQSSTRDPNCSFSLTLLCTKPFKIDAHNNGRLRLFNTIFRRYEKEEITEETRAGTQEKFHMALQKHFKIDLRNHELRLSDVKQKKFYALPSNLIPAEFLPLYGTRRKQSAVKFFIPKHQPHQAKHKSLCSPK